MAKNNTADLLAALKAKLEEQASCNDEESKAQAKAATAQALRDILLHVSNASKQDMQESIRNEVDTSLMEDAHAIKWPLLRSLEIVGLHRAFLGLPRTMEQTRCFLTLVSPNKIKDICSNLCQNILKCTDTQQLRWTQDVLVFMTGAGRFKKDLGGYELKGPGKNTVRAAMNQTRKRIQELEKAQETAKPKKPVQYEMEQDVRLQDQEREEARASGMGYMVDQALKKNDK